MTYPAIQQYLSNARDNWAARDSTAATEALRTLKKQAVAKGREEWAKTLWCTERVLEIQDGYIGAFNSLKSSRFYDGWCGLERVEVALGFLARHFDCASEVYSLRFIDTHTARLQSLFPYRFFTSPEFVELVVRCNICGRALSIRNPCGHRTGEIYNGEACFRIVEKWEVIAMSIVTNPAQKYSVMFLADPRTRESVDQYDYTVLKYLMPLLRSPFHGWRAEVMSVRHPHSQYRVIGRNDPCPCGSKRKYKHCCLRESGVLGRHIQFNFEVPPPKGSATEVFPDRMGDIRLLFENEPLNPTCPGDSARAS